MPTLRALRCLAVSSLFILFILFLRCYCSPPTPLYLSLSCCPIRPQDTLPTMVPHGAESELLAAESVVNFIVDDLIMVPRSQLRPDFSLPDPEDHAIGR